MAEFSAGEIDAHAAAEQETPAEQTADNVAEAASRERPVLAIGAKGPNVEKLKNLLRVLGYQVAANDELGVDCAEVVRQAQLAHGVGEPILLDAADVHVGIEGDVVGPATWAALYEAAGFVLEQRAG